MVDQQIVEVVDEAMSSILEEVFHNIESQRDSCVYEGPDHVETAFVIRLDWESKVPMSPRDLANATIECISNELYDILENGSDHYLPLAGKRLSGLDLKRLDIGKITLYPEFNMLRDSYEYAAFIRFSPIWA